MKNEKIYVIQFELDIIDKELYSIPLYFEAAENFLLMLKTIGNVELISYSVTEMNIDGSGSRIVEHYNKNEDYQQRMFTKGLEDFSVEDGAVGSEELCSQTEEEKFIIYLSNEKIPVHTSSRLDWDKMRGLCYKTIYSFCKNETQLEASFDEYGNFIEIKN